jgi:hypothetical protein
MPVADEKEDKDKEKEDVHEKCHEGKELEDDAAGLAYFNK